MRIFVGWGGEFYCIIVILLFYFIIIVVIFVFAVLLFCDTRVYFGCFVYFYCFYFDSRCVWTHNSDVLRARPRVTFVYLCIVRQWPLR